MARIAKGLYWDRAWSLVSGCSYVSPGCDNCWAAREAHTRAHQQNPKISSRYKGLTESGKWADRIRLMSDNLDLPLRVKKPTVWAVWNDLFHEDVPFEFLDRVFAVMFDAGQHIFMILTKRPERMREYLSPDNPRYTARKVFDLTKSDAGKFDCDLYWPLTNAWIGTTTENQEQANKRIPALLRTPAAVRFVSVEPMLSEVDLKNIILSPAKDVPFFGGTATFGQTLNALNGKVCNWCPGGARYTFGPKLDGVIAGVESGPGRRPANIKWIRSLRDQCIAAGVCFFLKQMEVDGKLIKMPGLDGRIWDQLPGVAANE